MDSPPDVNITTINVFPSLQLLHQTKNTGKKVQLMLKSSTSSFYGFRYGKIQIRHQKKQQLN